MMDDSEIATSIQSLAFSSAMTADETVRLCEDPMFLEAAILAAEAGRHPDSLRTPTRARETRLRKVDLVLACLRAASPCFEVDPIVKTIVIAEIAGRAGSRGHALHDDDLSI